MLKVHDLAPLLAPLQQAYDNDGKAVQTSLFGPPTPKVRDAHFAVLTDAMRRLVSSSVSAAFATAKQHGGWTDEGSLGALAIYRTITLADRNDPHEKHSTRQERLLLAHVAALEFFRCGRHAVASAILQQHTLSSLNLDSRSPLHEACLALRTLVQGRPTDWVQQADAALSAFRRQVTGAEALDSAAMGVAAIHAAVREIHAGAVGGKVAAWTAAHGLLENAKRLVEDEPAPALRLLVDALARALTGLQALSVREWERRTWPAGAPPVIQSWVALLATRRPFLFPCQLEVLEKAHIERDETAFVAMPTGAGKTLLAEAFTAARLSMAPEGIAVVIVPSRALATEKHADMEAAFPDIGVAKLTGDVLTDAPSALKGNRIVVTTPEKFDILLRQRFFGGKPLGVVVDEFHMVGQGTRGIKLQLATKRFKKLYASPVLLISAIIRPLDLESLRTWVRADSYAHTDWQPVPIIRGTFDLHDHKNPKVEFNDGTVVRLEAHPDARSNSIKESQVAFLQEFCKTGTVLRYAQRKVIRQTQENVLEKDAETFLQGGLDLGVDERREDFARRLDRLTKHPTKLAYFLRQGIAIHHADLPLPARAIVEEAVVERVAKLVLATKTLADGINLPIETVWWPLSKSPGDDFDKQTFLNVAGRAGRPYRYVEGRVVISFKPTGAERYASDEDDARKLRDLTAEGLDRLVSAAVLPARKLATLQENPGWEPGRDVPLMPNDRRAAREIENLVGTIEIVSSLVLASIVEQLVSSVDDPEMEQAVLLGTEEPDEIAVVQQLLAFVQARLVATGCIQMEDGALRVTHWGKTVYATGLGPFSAHKLRDRLRDLQKTHGSQVWRPGAWGKTSHDAIQRILQMVTIPHEFNVEPEDAQLGAIVATQWMMGRPLGDIPQLRDDYLVALRIVENHVAMWYSWLVSSLATIAEHESTILPQRRRDLMRLASALEYGDYRPWVQLVLRQDIDRALLRDDVIAVHRVIQGKYRKAAIPDDVLSLLESKEIDLRLGNEETVQRIRGALERARLTRPPHGQARPG